MKHWNLRVVKAVADIWITSDLHFGHKNLVSGVSSWSDKSGCRDFSTIEEMNDTLISRINSVVGKNDILWHLGDFALGPKKLWPGFRNRINCENIYHIAGNHDADWDELGYSWFFKKIYGKKREYTILHRKFHGQEFVLSHFPILSWDEKNHGAIMAHGHCHNNMSPWINSFMPNSKIIDVGIDAHPEGRPYNVLEVIKLMENKTADAIDHHVAETPSKKITNRDCNSPGYSLSDWAESVGYNPKDL